MADTTNLTQFLTDVAGAIKEKTGKEEKIPAENFDEEIRNIETGIDTSSNNPITSDDVLVNKEGFVNGEKVIGTLPDYADSTIDSEFPAPPTIEDMSLLGSISATNSLMVNRGIIRTSTKAKMIIPKSTLVNFLQLTPEKIVKGNTILDVEGTAETGSTINNQDISVTKNGTYTAEEGYTGLGTVTVNVNGEDVQVLLFNSKEELDAFDTSELKQGQLALVYKRTPVNIFDYNEEHQFSGEVLVNPDIQNVQSEWTASYIKNTIIGGGTSKSLYTSLYGDSKEGIHIYYYDDKCFSISFYYGAEGYMGNRPQLNFYYYYDTGMTTYYYAYNHFTTAKAIKPSFYILNSGSISSSVKQFINKLFLFNEINFEGIYMYYNATGTYADKEKWQPITSQLDELTGSKLVDANGFTIYDAKGVKSMTLADGLSSLETYQILNTVMPDYLDNGAMIFATDKGTIKSIEKTSEPDFENNGIAMFDKVVKISDEYTYYTTMCNMNKDGISKCALLRKIVDGVTHYVILDLETGNTTDTDITLENDRTTHVVNFYNNHIYYMRYNGATTNKVHIDFYDYDMSTGASTLVCTFDKTMSTSNYHNVSAVGCLNDKVFVNVWRFELWLFVDFTAKTCKEVSIGGMDIQDIVLTDVDDKIYATIYTTSSWTGSSSTSYIPNLYIYDITDFSTSKYHTSNTNADSGDSCIVRNMVYRNKINYMYCNKKDYTKDVYEIDLTTMSAKKTVVAKGDFGPNEYSTCYMLNDDIILIYNSGEFNFYNYKNGPSQINRTILDHDNESLYISLLGYIENNKIQLILQNSTSDTSIAPNLLGNNKFMLGGIDFYLKPITEGDLKYIPLATNNSHYVGEEVNYLGLTYNTITDRSSGPISQEEYNTALDTAKDIKGGIE